MVVMYPPGKVAARHTSCSHQPDVRQHNLSVCSSPAALSAALKRPRPADEEALLVRAVAGPLLVFVFRSNTVVHSAVTLLSQQSGSLQSCLRCSRSSLGGGGVWRRCVHLDHCLSRSTGSL